MQGRSSYNIMQDAAALLQGSQTLRDASRTAFLLAAEEVSQALSPTPAFLWAVRSNGWNAGFLIVSGELSVLIEEQSRTFHICAP